MKKPRVWPQHLAMFGGLFLLVFVLKAVASYYARFFSWLERAFGIAVGALLVVSIIFLVWLKCHSLFTVHCPHIRRP